MCGIALDMIWRKKVNKVVFLDRDGTINKDKAYVHAIEDFEFLPGVIQALQKFMQLGYKLIIITNQSGIARGFYSEESYLALDQWMKAQLRKEGIEILDSFYCPHLPDAPVEKYRVECLCRKPGIELFEKAIQKYKVDVNNSIAVGDRIRDVQICKKYPIKGFVLYQDIEKTENNIHFLRGGMEEVVEKI